MDLNGLTENAKKALAFSRELEDALAKVIDELGALAKKYEQQGLDGRFLAPLTLMGIKHFYESFEKGLPGAAALVKGFEKFKFTGEAPDELDVNLYNELRSKINGKNPFNQS